MTLHQELIKELLGQPVCMDCGTLCGHKKQRTAYSFEGKWKCRQCWEEYLTVEEFSKNLKYAKDINIM